MITSDGAYKQGKIHLFDYDFYYMLFKLLGSDKCVKSCILLSNNLGSDISDDLIPSDLLYIILIYSISKE